MTFALESVPVPQIGSGEMLVRVHSSGVCGTDLKKISTGSHSAPRIFGHETSGTVAAVGDNVRNFRPGDRVMVFHHIPCRQCFYCKHKTFAQCPMYKKWVARQALSRLAGGLPTMFASWIGSSSMAPVHIPDGVSFEQACFVEPVNTCMKGIEALALQPGETVLTIGQGPIGIILSVLARRAGATLITSDLYPERLKIARKLQTRSEPLMLRE